MTSVSKRIVRIASSQVLKRTPVPMNLGKVVRFDLSGLILERRLVQVTDDYMNEINVESLVGMALSGATVGEQYSVPVPDGVLVVKVLAITDSLSREPSL